MRNLNFDELNAVQGSGIGAKWAFRAGELIADLYTLYEASQKIELAPSSYGSVDAGGYNPMGDYANAMCTR